MYLKHTCIPAVVASVLILGCGNKAEEQVPAEAPPAAKEPADILKNIKYIGARKDTKHLPVISLTDLDVAYAAACRLHKHAGELGIPLRDQDIMDLGVTDLRTRGYFVPGVAHADLAEAKAKAASGGQMLPWMQKLDLQKLDLLPDKDTLPDGKPNPEYQEIKAKYAQAAMQSGVFRVLSGVPERLWPKLVLAGTKADPQSADIQNLSIGFNSTIVMQVGVMKNKNGNYGIYDITLKSTPKQLMAQLEEAK